MVFNNDKKIFLGIVLILSMVRTIFMPQNYIG